ncbi:MAG: hypothetical protein RL289_694 [Actinomycetota bacterium]|jgi:hypothetical protein
MSELKKHSLVKVMNFAGEDKAEIGSVASGSSATAGALVNVPNKSGKAKKDKNIFLDRRCFTTTVKHTF